MDIGSCFIHGVCHTLFVVYQGMSDFLYILSMAQNLLLHACSFHAVELMRNGKTPSEAATTAILRISQYYPSFSGAVIAINMTGHYGK